MRSHNAYPCQNRSQSVLMHMQYALRDFLHNLAGTKLVATPAYALRDIMHYEVMHYEPVNCSGWANST